MTFEEKLAFLAFTKNEINKNKNIAINNGSEEEAIYLSGAESMLKKVIKILTEDD